MSALAGEYITYARQLCLNGSYAKALDLYLLAFDKNQQMKPLFELEFRSVIIKLSEVLAADNKIEDMFSSFGRALNMFPGNVYLMNEIGKYLYKFGYYEEAWNQFQKALEVDAGYVTAEKNLNSMKNLMVERWHFRMLNDKTRNKSYRAALQEVVKANKSTVLDLGTGTGLLAMYATEGNPAHVCACDSSEVMTTLAVCILKENQLLMSISVVNKMSTDMKHSDVGGKRSLVVTELFDAGLFGEHILQSLSHAWQHLLTKSAQIIPHSAEFFVLGAQSDMLNAKYQLCANAKSLLNIQKWNVHIALGDDTYDCEDILMYQDIKFLTEAAQVVKVDFTSLNDIQDKQNRTEPYSVAIKAVESGEMNLLLGWFNLNLTTNIKITTDPRDKNRANAWQQAIFFDCLPRTLKANDTFNVDFLMNSGKITKQPDYGSNMTRISPECLRFLNDTDYIRMIKNCISMAYMYLGQITQISDVKIVDLCPFPIFGMFMLKRGVQSLLCNARTENDRLFLENVFQQNGVDLSKVILVQGDKWSSAQYGCSKFHAIFCNIFELCGDIDVRHKELAEWLRSNQLLPGGLFLPSCVSLVAQIVSSDWLDLNNRVHDKNVGYKVSSHINKYQVSQNFCIDLTNLEYTPLSEPFVLGDCNHLISDVSNVPIKNEGDANAILCWYNIELMESLEIISTKRPFSFIDGTAFLANPIIPMSKGSVANILCCVDSDGSYKLVMDLETS